MRKIRDREKNDFAEKSKNLARLQIFRQLKFNYVERSNWLLKYKKCISSQKCLSFLHSNYFDSPTKYNYFQICIQLKYFSEKNLLFVYILQIHLNRLSSSSWNMASVIDHLSDAEKVFQIISDCMNTANEIAAVLFI